MDDAVEKILAHLASVLEIWGLSVNLEELIGLKFLYTDDEGHTVLGSVVAVGLGPKEAPKLYVSPKRFKGHDIEYLTLVDDEINIKTTEGYQPGHFHIV